MHSVNFQTFIVQQHKCLFRKKLKGNGGNKVLKSGEMKLLTVNDILIFFLSGFIRKCKKLGHCDYQVNWDKMPWTPPSQVTGGTDESFNIFIASFRVRAQFMNILPCINSP